MKMICPTSQNTHTHVFKDVVTKFLSYRKLEKVKGLFSVYLNSSFCSPPTPHFSWLCANRRLAILVKSLVNWRATFCWVCPHDPPSSLPISQPEPRLTSRLHFQQVPPFITRQGCWREMRGFRQGASNRAVCAPHPSYFFPPQSVGKKIGLCLRQQPHSCLTSFTIELQIYSGEDRPAPFYFSFAPLPLSFAPSYSAFLSLMPSSLDSTPLSLSPLLSPLPL